MVDWAARAQQKLAQYLVPAYVRDPAGTIEFTNTVLDPTGVVATHINDYLHSVGALQQAATATVGMSLDPTTKDTNPTLSNNNLTLIGSPNSGTAGASGPGWRSGKLYLEATADIASTAAGHTVIVGVGESDGFHHIPGNGDSKSVGLWSLPGTGPGYTAGDIIGMAVNLDTDAFGGLVRVWWRINATWVNDPASTVGTAVSTSTVVGTPIWPLFYVDPGQKLTVNFGATAFAHAPPTGFVAWPPRVGFVAPQPLGGIQQAAAGTVV